MNIIYDKKTFVILYSSSSNNEFSGCTSDAVTKMFPGVDADCCKMHIDASISVIGCLIHVDNGVAFKITNGDLVVYEMPKEEFERIVYETQKKQREELLVKFPCNCDNGSLKQFVDKLSKLPQTEKKVASSLCDGSFFDNPLMKVGWWGSFTDAGGYANMNREIVRRLHNHHIIPYIRMYSTVSQVDRPVMDLLNQYADLKPKRGPHPFVYAYTPMPHDFHGGKRIFFTMMETATLHPIFVDHCNRFSDEVWVPSQANKELFEGHGINKRIKVVPLGIDEIVYFQSGREKKDLSGFVSLFGQPAEMGLKSFKFLTVIQWNFRKGFDALIKSFVNAFTASDDVCLVIGTQYSRETVLGDLEPFLPRANDMPQVVLYNNIIPTVDMPGFYRNFDCYIHMSRGEGFSLTQIEAGACGLPVISNFHSGMTEYLSEDNSFTIQCKEIEKSCHRLSSICLYYQGQYLWKVGERQIEQAIDYMRYVVDNYDNATIRAKTMYDDIVEKYTWEKTAHRVADMLRQA